MALLQSLLPHTSTNLSISPNKTQILEFKFLNFSNLSKFESLQHSITKSTHRIFRIRCTGQESIVFTADGGNGKGGFPSDNGGGGGGGDDGDGGDYDEKEFGPVVKFDEVIKEVENLGVNLPVDMLEAAKTTGIRRLILDRYLDMQGSAWPLGFLMRHCSMLRNRMLADPSFLFKVGTEIVIDSCCATFAEVQKRGKDFWAEFELYAADLLVGIVVDIALVGMLAPYVRIGKQSVSSSSFGRFRHACGALPSSSSFNSCLNLMGRCQNFGDAFCRWNIEIETEEKHTIGSKQYRNDCFCGVIRKAYLYLFIAIQHNLFIRSSICKISTQSKRLK